MIMRTTCKNCWAAMTKDLINNNRSFCSKKCRILWDRKHGLKHAKRKLEVAVEDELMTWGLSSSACDKGDRP